MTLTWPAASFCGGAGAGCGAGTVTGCGAGAGSGAGSGTEAQEITKIVKKIIDSLVFILSITSIIRHFVPIVNFRLDFYLRYYTFVEN